MLHLNGTNLKCCRLQLNQPISDKAENLALGREGFCQLQFITAEKPIEARQAKHFLRTWERMNRNTRVHNLMVFSNVVFNFACDNY